MRPTDQETTPTGKEHYTALKAIVKNLSRRERESVALRLAEFCDEQDKTIKGHERIRRSTAASDQGRIPPTQRSYARPGRSSYNVFSYNPLSKEGEGLS